METHRQMLRRICTLGRVAGWAIIAMGLMGVGILAFEGWSLLPLVGIQGVFRESADVLDQILMGLVVLGVVQFIRYVIEEGTEPKWLLRNGHIVLCLFALSLLLTWALREWPLVRNASERMLAALPEHMIPIGRPLAVATIIFTALLPALAKVLCVVGIAATLRTVLPIMAESKTLA